MQIQDILYYVFWAGLFFVMMRFGCGAHIMGHGHHHHAAAVPDPAPGTGVKPPVPERVTDPACGMNVQTSVAKTAAYRGQIYYFCAQKCREKFESAPESYAN
jgi:YHS domain-containing protein